MIPSMHKPIPLGTKVVIPKNSGYVSEDHTGEVVGISSQHIMFTYIVLLDEPIVNEYGINKAICVIGTQLENLDGSNFRLES